MNITSIIFNTFFTILGAFLSVTLAKILKQNGTVLKRMDEGFRMISERMDEGFKRMDEGFKMIAKLIVTENERTRKAILKKLK